MQAGGVPSKCQQTVQQALRVIEERLTTTSVDSAHPAKMSVKVTVADKPRQRRLLPDRRLSIHQGSGPLESLYRLLGHNRVSQPESWKERPAETSHIYDALRYETLNGREWRTVEAG